MFERIVRNAERLAHEANPLRFEPERSPRHAHPTPERPGEIRSPCQWGTLGSSLRALAGVLRAADAYQRTGESPLDSLHGGEPEVTVEELLTEATAAQRSMSCSDSAVIQALAADLEKYIALARRRL